MTIGYKDNDGKEQVAVLELGKDIVRTTLPILEARSGKKIEYQDEKEEKGQVVGVVIRLGVCHESKAKKEDGVARLHEPASPRRRSGAAVAHFAPSFIR